MVKVIRLNRLIKSFPIDPLNLLRRHLSKELIEFYRSAERAKQERMARICFDERRMRMENIGGIYSVEGPLHHQQQHFDATEPPEIARRGRFLTTVHVHIPHQDGDERGLENFSDDDLDVVVEHGSCFFVYPRGKDLMLAGAWIVRREPTIKHLKIGSRYKG